MSGKVRLDWRVASRQLSEKEFALSSSSGRVGAEEVCRWLHI